MSKLGVTNRTFSRLRQLNRLSWLKGGILFAFLAFFLYQLQNQSNEQLFYFSAIEDNFYENPANWNPYYPGTKIAENSKVSIQDLVYLSGFTLEVEGELEITQDASIFSAEDGLLITESGKLKNHGLINVAQIENNHTFLNKFGGTVQILNYSSSMVSKLNNGRSASFSVIEEFDNRGEFYNYGLCKVGSIKSNKQYTGLPGSEVIVRGKILGELKTDKSDEQANLK